MPDPPPLAVSECDPPQEGPQTPKPAQTVDLRRLLGTAGAQEGLLTTAQCRSIGLTDKAIEHRVRSARWLAVHPGVYQTLPGREGSTVDALAQLLRAQPPRAPGPLVAFCGPSAAHAWGWTREPPELVHLVIPERRRLVPREGVVLRRSFRFGATLAADVLPWRTTPAATVLDCAALGDAYGALRWVTDAVREQWSTVDTLALELGNRDGHRHGRVLRPAFEIIAEGAESLAEVLYVRRVERAHGLPAGRRQVAGGPFGAERRHDTAYEEYGVLVEVDGRIGHESWAARVRDGRRDRSALRSGQLTLRVFWPDVDAGACGTAVELGAILRSRGWRGRPHPCGRPGCAVSES